MKSRYRSDIKLLFEILVGLRLRHRFPVNLQAGRRLMAAPALKRCPFAALFVQVVPLDRSILFSKRPAVCDIVAVQRGSPPLRRTLQTGGFCGRHRARKRPVIHHDNG